MSLFLLDGSWKALNVSTIFQEHIHIIYLLTMMTEKKPTKKRNKKNEKKEAKLCHSHPLQTYSN